MRFIFAPIFHCAVSLLLHTVCPELLLYLSHGSARHPLPSLHTHSGIQTTLSTFIYFYYFRLTIPPHPFVTHPQLHTAPINHP